MVHFSDYLWFPGGWIKVAAWPKALHQVCCLFWKRRFNTSFWERVENSIGRDLFLSLKSDSCVRGTRHSVPFLLLPFPGRMWGQKLPCPPGPFTVIKREEACIK